MAVARMPFTTEGLDVWPLHVERRVLLVAEDHRLASRASVRLVDFVDEPLARLVDADPDFAAFWRLEPRPDGSSAPPGPLVDTPQDRYEAVAAGDAVALATAATLEQARPPGVTSVPVDNVDPVEVVLATRRGERSELVDTFVRLAIEQLANHDSAGPDTLPPVAGE